MGKHPPVKDQFLHLFSSSELIALYISMFYTAYNLNIYAAFIVFMIVMKTVGLHPIKSVMNKTTFGIRPKKAFNCNMMSCGGKPASGGFPSGHMVLLGMLSFIVYHLYKEHKNTNVIIIYSILIVTTAIGRLFTYCHTPLQTFSGLFIGLLMGALIYIADQFIENYIPIYKRHKDEFYDDINVITLNKPKSIQYV